MKYFVKLVVIYPHGVVPDGFPPEAIDLSRRFETYVPRFCHRPPQIGDRHECNGRSWIVTDLHRYRALEPSQKTDVEVYEAWCYADQEDSKKLPYRRDWSDCKPHYAYFRVSQDGLANEDWGMIFDLKRTTEVLRLRSGEALDIQAFVPVNGRSIAGFDQILLCWSAQEAEAISAAS
jgi:hypothetical protein